MSRSRCTNSSAAEPSCGYRSAWAELRATGWRVNHKRVQRLWQQLDLCHRQRPRRKPRPKPSGERPQTADHPNHVWTYDFIEVRTSAGRKLRILTVVDEFTRRCLALRVEHSQSAQTVVATLDWLFLVHGRAEFVRSDNGPEFVAERVKAWLGSAGSGTIYIDPGCPWQNPYVESFHSRFRAECLNFETFANRREAEEVIEAWRVKYNERRRHSRLDWLTPEEFTDRWRKQASGSNPLPS